MKIFKIIKLTGMLLVFGFIGYVLSTYLLNSYKDTSEKIEVKPQNTSIKRSKEDNKVKPKGTLIKIFKEERLLELYNDGELIYKFNIGLGSAPVGDKNKEGDRKTPVGKYYVCTRNDKSRFTLFLGISYPNIEDAKRGLESGLINQDTFEQIKQANINQALPPWKTPLGGEVGIHGGGSSSDWTWGCIALSDENIKILWKYTKLKTPVEIYE
ncbi:MAG: L,D-transpeptidase family protein [Tepidibacter sp.]|jgi:murein L,D-transpeptidase YafK|uniref:L,D-transpeptidase family protein n=1 Tax=Tepidibacter sp. TaxID=2529387 RepID=UPI0025EA339B|nr:L,D-transpeptidase family protein [Tepidibacter sp.]MCT4507875.1 L,D-transpeptidase family protein [Tepidibacter sp.]